MDLVPSSILVQKIAKAQKRKAIIKLVVEICATALVTLIIFGVIIGVSPVTGSSMSPTLADKEVVVFLRVGNKYRKNDLIVFEMPGEDTYVKRVIAVEGDTVDIDDKTGVVYVNGLPEVGDYGITHKRLNGIELPLTVPKGKVFVLGDNRKESRDSREADVGLISFGDIHGKIFFSFKYSY